ncbi:unnamed protein product [Thelazia callipaeda]|uniref:Wiskott-Aldrich syndrome protein family member n=1 Tax=Thelazia callipaeda TaxID=103827 RepID=A0A0N5CPC9_THECL|nr:unnamed protein product [Thelazia callipaeda]
MKHFFETINPLNGFDGKEALETYMWEQSLKVEPKDPDKMEVIKPSRPVQVLKSPGIKPPKAISSVPSVSGPSNHYSGHRASGRGFTAHNNYSSNVSHSSDVSRPNFLSILEDRNSHLGMVEINPGQQPRYLGDAKRGTQSTVTSPTESRAPPIMPRVRHRNDKASSTPPSPQSKLIDHSPSSSPPPLYPRKLSSLEQPAPPTPFKVLPHLSPTLNESIPPHSAPFCSVSPVDSFVFPPHGGSAACSRATLGSVPITVTPMIRPLAAPTVPPRKKVEKLPSPLSDVTMLTVWDGENRPTVSDMNAATLSPLPSSSVSALNNIGTTIEGPRLYPRKTHPLEPPPRPPKTLNSKKCQELLDGKSDVEVNCNSPPPPLPPKTYKRKQQNRQF